MPVASFPCLQCLLYLLSAFGCSQADFTLLAIRFLLVSFRVFIRLRVFVRFIDGCNDSFWFRCLYSENIIAHHHDMYICSSFLLAFLYG